jgi:hypothetical protein
MKPFVYSFYRNKGAFDIPTQHIERSNEVSLDIMLWRAFLCLTHLKPLQFARSIESFRCQDARLVLETDACLSGFGLVLSGLAMLEEGTTPIYCSYMRDYNIGVDSSYQNSMEFIGIVLGVAVAVRYGYRNISLIIKGDSMSALCWAEKGMLRSMHIRRASTMLVMLTVTFGIEIVDSVHIPGIDNIICDRLSRGEDPTKLGWGGRVCVGENDEWLMSAMSMCDPKLLLESEEDFTIFWKNLNDWIKMI